MTAGPFWYGPEHVQAACLKALWSYLPTVYDSGSLLYGASPQAPFPLAPAAFEGLGSCYPSDRAYFARGLVADDFPFPVPSVVVDVRGGEQVEWFDDQRQVWRIPVSVWYMVGIDASTQTATNAVAMARQVARAGALAAQAVLMRYVAPIARALDASGAWGISHAERGGLSDAEAGHVDLDRNRSTQIVAAATSTTWVYQIQGAPWSATAGAVTTARGDYAVYFESDYVADQSDAVTNDFQVTTDDYRIYVRAGSDWSLVGSAADGRLTVNGIATWTDPGDQIADGVVVEDTATSVLHEWDGAAWARLAPTLHDELAGGITGARLLELVAAGEATVHVNSGSAALSGSALRLTLDGTAAEQRVVISVPLTAPTASVYAGGRITLVSGGGAGVLWEAVIGWMVDTGSTDLATASLIEQGGAAVSIVRRMGGMGRDATNLRRLAERDGSSVISTLGTMTAASSQQSTTATASAVRSRATMHAIPTTASGEATTEAESAMPALPPLRWLLLIVARCRSGGAVVLDIEGVHGGSR